MSCYFYFVILPLGPELWWVLCYIFVFCALELVYLFVLCVACLIVFVNCLVKQFAMCLGVVAILLLNGMDVFSVRGGALLD